MADIIRSYNEEDRVEFKKEKKKDNLLSVKNLFNLPIQLNVIVRKKLFKHFQAIINGSYFRRINSTIFKSSFLVQSNQYKDNGARSSHNINVTNYM